MVNVILTILAILFLTFIINTAFQAGVCATKDKFKKRKRKKKK